MYIAMISAECAPVVQESDAAEMVYGLSRELEMGGNDVHVVLPKYDCMRYDQVWDLHLSYRDLWVPWYGGAIRCDVWHGFVHCRKCFFVEPHSEDRFFERGRCYGCGDDVDRFAFFSKAALEFLLQDGHRPDVIHCHDWQTALVPVLLYEIYEHCGLSRQRVCYTVHDFRHQGRTGEQVLYASGMPHPRALLRGDRLLDDGGHSVVNLMKGGIVYSNFVTTVSPRHADEALHTEQGQGLGPTLQAHRRKFGGILNGVDYDTWSPEIDDRIPRRYGAGDLDAKQENTEALRERFLLRPERKPIVAYVGRLDEGKGWHLIHHGLRFALARGAQFVLLGAISEPDIEREVWHLKHHFEDHPDCHLEIGYSQELAHLVYAGADMLIIPSLLEPGGLSQLIALRYGTVPIVRAVGGLIDTVFDKDFSDKPPNERNGFVFQRAEPLELESAVGRAIDLWRDDPDGFRQLMTQGMACDHSWRRAGQDYLNIYHYIRQP